MLDGRSSSPMNLDTDSIPIRNRLLSVLLRLDPKDRTTHCGEEDEEEGREKKRGGRGSAIAGPPARARVCASLSSPCSLKFGVGSGEMIVDLNLSNK